MADSPVKLRPEILAQAAYKQGRPAPAGAFKLSSNELPFPPLPSVVEAVNSALEYNRYQDASAGAVREALGEHYGLTADHVLVGAGSVSLLYQAVQAACSLGDEVVYPWRSFEAYPQMMGLAGATAVPVALRPDGSLDLDGLADAVSDRTRLLLICSPNNPTGPAVNHEDFIRFLDDLPDDLLVIADEAYIEFVTDPRALNSVRLLPDHRNLVVARTFSKAYGLAGLRAGYMLGDPAVLAAIHTAAIPFLVSAQAQAAVLAVMRETEAVRRRVDEITVRRDEVRRALLDQGWPVPDSQANFLWLPAGEQAQAVGSILQDGNIIARVFPGDGLRISIGEEASIEPLLKACAAAIDRYPYLRAETPAEH